MASFPGAYNNGNGWYHSWIGWFYTTSGSDWLWHDEHGWLSPNGTEGLVWFWDSSMNYWWWSSPENYPYIVIDGTWSWYQVGSIDPRTYYNYGASRWEFSLFYSILGYEPDYWNPNYAIQRYNNCYNYACNKVTNTYAQPGCGSGAMITEVTVQAVRDAALRDGLEIGTAHGPVPQGKTRLAMVIDPYLPDYHWYRQDINGKWSHKRGGTPVQNLDASFREILDIETADWGSYEIFGGYFFADSSSVQGLGTEDIW